MNSDTTPQTNELDMTAYQLVYAPHQMLETQVQPFIFDKPEYRQAVSYHMQNLCRNHKGLGLAANQINLNAAVFVVHVQKDLVTMFNPQIHGVSDDKVLMSEGCLSDPGMYLKVKRPDMVTASWEDETGKRSQATLFGMDCRVFLHEYDHLQGIMFTDRVGNIKLKMARKKQGAALNRAAQRIMANMA
jgi:peptide deformylase